MARLLQLFEDVSETTKSSAERFSGSIAGEFVNARIAAFGRANHVLRLCRVCLDREIAARRMISIPRRTGATELLDPLRDWCFLCGALAPTLPALPRARRGSRRAVA